MKETRIIMGMPVTIDVVDARCTTEVLERVFAYFEYVESVFSVFRPETEISKINRGELSIEESSDDVRTIFMLAEETKNATEGYFNIVHPNGTYNPSGLVKGWAIFNAAELLRQEGFIDFYVDAGSDIEMSGHNAHGELWSVGIRNPFGDNRNEIVKVVYGSDMGVATSGSYIRGDHIYNPHTGERASQDVVSLTVVGPNIYEADRFATAGFAMGKNGILFIEKMPGIEGYMITKEGLATETSGFHRYTRI